jgi:hypothetical protein
MNGYPGPFKCPDCGVWWAGFEHRCRAPISVSVVNNDPVTYTVKCICDQKGKTTPEITCPVHDILITYTTYGTSNAPS